MKTQLFLQPTVKTPFGNFELGEEVTYSVYPHGDNLKGIICNYGIQAIKETAVYFITEQISTFADFNESQISEINPVKKPTNKEEQFHAEVRRWKEKNVLLSEYKNTPLDEIPRDIFTEKQLAEIDMFEYIFQELFA